MAKEVASQKATIGRLERRFKEQEKLMSLLLSSCGKHRGGDKKDGHDEAVTQTPPVSHNTAIKNETLSRCYIHL